MAALTTQVIDFESFYSDDYSLSKMTAEEYVRDDRFELIGVSVRPLSIIPAHAGSDREFRAAVGPKVWVTGTDIIPFLRSEVDWPNTVAIGHNMSEFDALILTERVGVRPREYGCTLQLARCLHGSKDSDGKNIANSLDGLARMYRAPIFKGKEVLAAKGKRLRDFTPAELDAYGRYCDDDTLICGWLWKQLAPRLPRDELVTASLVTRMWAEAKLHLDRPLLEAMTVDIATRQRDAMLKVADKLGVSALLDTEGRVEQAKKLVSKDAVLANLLTDLGVEPPMKASPKRKDAAGQPLQVYAFAKTDEGMQELLDYEDESDGETSDTVQALAQARITAKSTQGATRVARLHGISTRGALPVPLCYGKTGTHRLSGGGKINLQNLPQLKMVTPKTKRGALIVVPGGFTWLDNRKVEGGKVVAVRGTCGRVWHAIDGEPCWHLAAIRDTLIAPSGYKIVAADSSNIELRTGHLYCGQEDTSAMLASGEDLYCSFASTLYDRPITKADKRERQHGKVAHLQLLYQSGAGAFKNAARIMGGIRLSDLEADNTVRLYRDSYQNVRAKWNQCQRAINKMMAGGGGYLDEFGLCQVVADGVLLPNGMKIDYHNLRLMELESQHCPGQFEDQPIYDDKEKRVWKKIYGGKVFQNINQALARIVVFDQMREIERRWGQYALAGEGVVLAVHDEVVAVVRDDRAEDCLKDMLDIMHQSPKWWPQLVVKAEGAIGDRYSDCK